jgi:5-methylcytosine-specific restriction endonuclease McrA
MSRREFSVAVKKAAYARSGGICECGCGQPFSDHPKERPQYDHELPDFLGGTNDLENCKAIRTSCHIVKTFGDDMTKIKKVRRGQKDRLNITPHKPQIAGSKGGKWKRKINGQAVLRDKGT